MSDWLASTHCNYAKTPPQSLYGVARSGVQISSAEISSRLALKRTEARAQHRSPAGCKGRSTYRLWTHDIGRRRRVRPGSIYSFSLAARQLLLLLLWSRPIKSVGTGAFLACPGLNSSMSTDLIGAQVHSPPHVRPGRQHIILHMTYVRCHITQCMHCLPYWLVRATQTAHQRSMD